jgi:predicted NBD/HSP70 family sugar kinase
MISPPDEPITTLSLGPQSLPMRKINRRNFRLATRSTRREVNRRIILSLIREYQPISRAELARRMQVHRGTMTPLVRELVESGVVFEKGTAATARGRRPTLLCVRTRGRLVVAVDIRPGRSVIALADVSGHVLARDAFDTPDSPAELPDLLAAEVANLLRQHAPDGVEGCQGLGIVLPGMVDRKTGRLIYAPRLGWRDVDLRSTVAQRVGMRCYIESAPIACALARLWLEPDATRAVNSFAYVSVSDGIGVGLALNGEMLRGEAHTAGEFGHVSLDSSGPECVCGRTGCWEALACGKVPVIADSPNSATRHFALDARSLFKNKDAADLCKKIEYWIEHPEEKAAMSQKYIQAARDNSLSKSIEKIEQVYRQVIDEHERKKQENAS